MTISIHEFPTLDMQAAVQDAVESVRRYIPRWLLGLGIEYSATPPEPETSADVDCSWQYREAGIRIYPTFFSLSAEQKRRVLLHEVVHILLGGLQALVGEEHGDSREWEWHCEAAVEDITQALLIAEGEG